MKIISDPEFDGRAKCPDCGCEFLFSKEETRTIRVPGYVYENGEWCKVLGLDTLRVVKCPKCGLLLDKRFIQEGRKLF